MKKLTIADYWTPDEALTFVAFLEQLIDAVWAEHGNLMARQLGRAEDHAHFAALARPPHLEPDPHDLLDSSRALTDEPEPIDDHYWPDDDEIPF